MLWADRDPDDVWSLDELSELRKLFPEPEQFWEVFNQYGGDPLAHWFGLESKPQVDELVAVDRMLGVTGEHAEYFKEIWEAENPIREKTIVMPHAHAVAAAERMASSVFALGTATKGRKVKLVGRKHSIRLMVELIEKLNKLYRGRIRYFPEQPGKPRRQQISEWKTIHSTEAVWCEKNYTDRFLDFDPAILSKGYHHRRAQERLRKMRYDLTHGGWRLNNMLFPVD